MLPEKGPRTFVVALMATALIASRAASAQTPTDGAPPGAHAYSQVLDRYQHGDGDAVAALIALHDTDVAAGQKVIVQAFERSRGLAPAAARLRLAALIHIEAVFDLAGRDRGQALLRHQAIARADLDALAERGRDGFVRDCWMLLIAFYQGRLELVAAHALWQAAHKSAGDSPELWLAAGVTEEMAWTMVHSDDYEGMVAGSLKEAESAYRKALDRQPDLVEARLRLGRVLTLKGDNDGALREFDALRATDDSGFRYLAHLFAGDALERSGRRQAAEGRYIAAFAALPEGQSARLALTQIRHAAGARTAAADAARAALDRRVGETADPWLWYTVGLSWRAGHLLSALREQVRR
jgi:tetratricopeptide (TPR) repeat protein